METKKKAVIGSEIFEEKDLPSIYDYGRYTFGVKLADVFYFEIVESVNLLSTQYYLHPECRHLETTDKIYRNIILGSYLIIYRITEDKIEVLRALHGSHSPEYIKSIKNISI